MKFADWLFVFVSIKPVCYKFFSLRKNYDLFCKNLIFILKNVDRFIDPVKNLHSPAVLRNNR